MAPHAKAYLAYACKMALSFHRLPKKISRSSLKDLELQREADISGEPKDDDHPNIKEIRRRLVAMIEEAAECNFI